MRRSLAALVVLIAFAGCGGGSDTDVAALVARAVSSSEDAESFRLAATIEATGKDTFSLTGEVVSAADQSRGRFEGTMATAGEPPQQLEFIYADGAFFYRGEFVEGVLPAGKEWVRVKESAPATMTPSEFAQFLQGSDEIEDVGTEEVRGAPAVHLSGPIDIQELAKSTSSAAESYVDQIPPGVELETDIDAWLREKTGEIVRMAVVMSVAGTDDRIEMRGDILEYDVPLDGAEAPDPSTVAQP